MNSQYQLFGPNPLVDALHQFLYGYVNNSSQATNINPQIEKPNASEELAQCEYVPKIEKKQTKINRCSQEIWGLRAKALRAEKDQEAYFALKKVCELTVDNAGDWKKLLILAQKSYTKAVPSICMQILTYVKNPALRMEAEALLFKQQKRCFLRESA